MASETAWLSESGRRGSVGWDAEYPRVLTLTHLRDRSSGREFAASNAHFDHVGARARIESAGLVRERVDATSVGSRYPSDHLPVRVELADG